MLISGTDLKEILERMEPLTKECGPIAVSFDGEFRVHKSKVSTPGELERLIQSRELYIIVSGDSE